MEKAKYKALDIANFYIQLVNSISDNYIDNLKINKLLYFVQGFSMAKLGRPMFSDVIQAWEYGPVIPNVYYTFKCCGKSPIEEPADNFDESVLSVDELELLIDIYSTYGKYTGWALKDITHKKGSPWSLAYVPNQNNEIALKSLSDYFSDERLESFDISKLNIPTVDKIPAEWDSNEDSIYD